MKSIKINLDICLALLNIHNKHYILSGAQGGSFSALEEHHISITSYMNGRLSQHKYLTATASHQYLLQTWRAALMMPWSLWSPTPPAVRSGSSQHTVAGCQRSGSVRFGRGSAQSRCTERYHHLLLQQQKASDYRELSIQDWLASFIYYTT